MVDNPSVGELTRRIADLVGRFDRFDQALSELVRKDVYSAEQQALKAELARLQTQADRLEAEVEAREKDRVKERGEARRYYWAALLVCVATAISTVIGEAVVRTVLG